MDPQRWRLAHVYDIGTEHRARESTRHGARGACGTRMPLRKIQDNGIVFGLGTDATIVLHYQPFVKLGWVVSGLDFAGNRVLGETLTVRRR